MSFGSFVTSILPTIGTVLGKLINCNSLNDGVIRYDLGQPGGGDRDAGAEHRVVFGKEGDEVRLYNMATTQNQQVTLSFPGKGDLGPETVTLQGFKSINVSDLFKNQAQMGNSEFALTTNDPASYDSGPDGAAQDICMSASAYHIPVGDGKPHQVGSYLRVRVDRDQAVVSTTDGRSISGIRMLAVSGASDTAVRLMNLEGPVSGGDSITARFPEKFPEGESVNVELTAQVGADYLSDRDELDRGIQPITEETARLLRTAKRLND